MSKRKRRSRKKKKPEIDYEAIPPLEGIADRFPSKFAESTPRIWGIINHLCKTAKVYVEVGSWAGATASAAKHKNKHLTAYAIDDLSKQTENGKDEHISRLKDNARHFGFKLIAEDYKEVLPRLIAVGLEIDVYLYDGPHTAQDQYDGLALAQPMLNKDATILVDDANWDYVRDATDKFCKEFDWEVVFEKLTKKNGSPDYWNGIQILKRK